MVALAEVVALAAGVEEEAADSGDRENSGHSRAWVYQMTSLDRSEQLVIWREGR